MFRFRVRVILILAFGGFLMVTTRLFYLQVVRGEEYRNYAENVRVETVATEASRGTVRGSEGEILAFEEPGFNVAMVPTELPEWQALCRPVLKLYALARRERILSVRDVTVMVRGGQRGGSYEVTFGLAASFLRLRGSEVVEKEEHGTALVVVPRMTGMVVEAVASAAKVSAKEMLKTFFDGLALAGRGWQRLGDPIVVARDVGFPLAAEVETHPDRYPGFRVVATARRSYPYDALAGHVLGYVSPIAAAEYDRWRESYGGSVAKRFLPDDLIGRSGIERAFDFELRPARGMRTLEVDAARRTQAILEEQTAEAGADVFLTIDRELQGAAEAALDGQIGSLVILEPATGRVLAMANSPRYNPNDIPGRPPDPADRTAPLLNRAIQGQYPLGSAFKLILAAGVLQENKVLGGVECTGSYLGHLCDNHSKPMHLDLDEAFKRSCNVYFYRTANEALGIRGVVKWATLFGLGQCTGVALPGEKPGLLPTPGWKQRRLREEWFAGDTCNLAIGGGSLLVTPIQIARLVAAIANGGKLVRPRVVDKIVRANGAVEKIDEGVCETLPLTPAKLARIHRVMRSVCHEMGGTARKAFGKSESQPDWVADQGYEVAGKTSTAGLGEGRPNIVWFVGFAPYNDPRVAFAVVLENQPEGSHGGEVAAPVIRRALERLPERYLEGVPGREQRQRARERLAGQGARP